MTERTTPVLAVEGLHTAYHVDEGRVHAVRGATFDVQPGRTLGIVGESGCGKSAAARSVLQLIEPPGVVEDGRVQFRWTHDEPPVDLLSYGRYDAPLRAVRGGGIGMIFQEPMMALSPVHTIGQQIAEVVQLHARVTRKVAMDRAATLLAKVGMPQPAERVHRYTFELSGGMRQRAMIAMALAAEPRLLIADEPTTALDVTTQAVILDLLRDLQEQEGMGLVLITHDLGVIADAADDVAVMYLGRVVERAPVKTLFRDPKHPYTRALMRSVPRVQLGPPADLDVIPGRVPAGTAQPPGCAFAARCDLKISGLCDVIAPSDVVLDDGQTVQCHAHDPTYQGRFKAADLQPNLAEPTRRVGEAVATSDKVVLDVRGLSVHYPVHANGLLRRRIGTVKAVQDATFTLHEGETFGLVGESGCGKSSLAQALVRLYRPHAGEAWVAGSDGATLNTAVATGQELKRVYANVRMVFQDPYGSLDPRMPVSEVIGEPIELLTPLSAAERDARVDELLEAVGLDPNVRHRYVHSFSGGQRQRIGIARALATEPSVLIADEAVSALDVSVQAQVLNLLKDLQTRRRLGMLFVSHDIGVVASICQRVAVMYAGRLVEIASKDDLFTRPRHPYTSLLLGAVLPPDPDHERPSVTGVEEGVADPADLPKGCAFAARCAFATDLCRAKVPELRLVEGVHVACHHAETVELPAPRLDVTHKVEA